MIAAVDPSGRGRELDAADPGPGYYALGGFGDGVPITRLPADLDAGRHPALLPRRHGIHPAQRGRHPDPGALPQERQARDRRHGGRPLSLQDADAPPGPDRLCFSQRLDRRRRWPPSRRSRPRRKAGRHPAFNDLLRDVLVIPAGTANYEVKASTKAGAGMMGRPLDATSFSPR